MAVVAKLLKFDIAQLLDDLRKTGFEKYRDSACMILAHARRAAKGHLKWPKQKGEI
jgi:hypothetical protein